MPRRTLSLKREVLAELTAGELGLVAGGTHAGCALTPQCTHLSLDVACPTNPVLACINTLQPACVGTR